MIFLAANRNPLSEGTAISFPSYYDHEVIICYAWNGQQFVLEKSKRIGKPTITDPEVYRGVPFVISRSPRSAEHGSQIVRNGLAEVQSGGKPWSIFDNCQDFVSRAYDRRNGSKSRSVAVGVAAVVGIAAMLMG